MLRPDENVTKPMKVSLTGNEYLAIDRRCCIKRDSVANTHWQPDVYMKVRP